MTSIHQFEAIGLIQDVLAVSGIFIWFCFGYKDTDKRAGQKEGESRGS